MGDDHYKSPPLGLWFSFYPVFSFWRPIKYTYKSEIIQEQNSKKVLHLPTIEMATGDELECKKTEELKNRQLQKQTKCAKKKEKMEMIQRENEWNGGNRLRRDTITDTSAGQLWPKLGRRCVECVVGSAAKPLLGGGEKGGEKNGRFTDLVHRQLRGLCTPPQCATRHYYTTESYIYIYISQEFLILHL